MLRFGVSAAHGGPHLLPGARRFGDALARRLQLAAKLVVAQDYDHLVTGVLSGGVDIAWMPPLTHVRAVAHDAVLAAVCERQGRITYRSALLTRTDSDFLNVRSLHGARAAWSDPRSAGGYLYPRLHLESVGIDPNTDLAGENFYGSPAAACGAVADGLADLCACFVSEAAGHDPARALEDVAQVFGPARWRLRVLAVTESIPPDGIVLGPHLDGALQAGLRDQLLQLHREPDGREALVELMQADRLAPVTADVRRVLERLREAVERL
jgi:phosphonate transport system substrate-binding protein